MASLPRFLLALTLGACGTPPPAGVEAPPAPASSAASATPAPCGEAASLVEAVRAAGAKERCAAQAARAALRRCPGLVDPVVASALAKEDDWRKERGQLVPLGPWMLERASKANETRVWELGPEGPALRSRIEGWDVALAARGRLLAAINEEIIVVDPRRGALLRLPGARFTAEGREHLFTGDKSQVRRYRLSDLSPDGAVAWEDPFEQMRGTEDHQILRDGGSLTVGEVLVSFDRKAVLRKGVIFGKPRPDGARILACDPATNRVIEVDAATGETQATFALRKGIECSAQFYAPTPGYGPDPRYAFWIEASQESKGGTLLGAAAGDTVTGRVQRLSSPRDGWSMGVSGDPFVDDDGKRMCARMHGTHVSWTVCTWRITPEGRVLRDPKPEPSERPTLAALGLADATELGRLWTAKRDRVLVLTFRQKGDDKHDMRLTIAGADGKIERAVALHYGQFFLDDALLRNPGREHELNPLPGLTLVDDQHAVVSKGVGSLETSVVDLRSGAVRRPCQDREGCEVVGRLAIGPGSTARDVVTDQELSFSASDEAWSTAPRVEGACPPRAGAGGPGEAAVVGRPP